MTNRRNILKAGLATLVFPIVAAIPIVRRRTYGRVPAASRFAMRHVRGVTVNGIPIEWACDGDDREGWVDYIVRDAGGKFVEENGRVKRTRIHGDVQFVLRDAYLATNITTPPLN